MRLALVLALTAALPAAAHDYRAGGLTIDHPVIYEGPPTQRSAAGYMTVRNDGAAADRLVGVRAEGARASLHETREADGVARMSPVDIIELPAGVAVMFAPGGLHLMFMDVDGAALRAGAKLDATLEFEAAGDVAVTFDVEKRPEAASAHDAHAGH